MAPPRCGIVVRRALSISLMARWSAWPGVSFGSGRCTLALPGEEAADGFPNATGAMVLSPISGAAGDSIPCAAGGVSSIAGGLAEDEELVTVIPRR